MNSMLGSTMNETNKQILKNPNNPRVSVNNRIIRNILNYWNTDLEDMQSLYEFCAFILFTVLANRFSH